MLGKSGGWVEQPATRGKHTVSLAPDPSKGDARSRRLLDGPSDPALLHGKDAARFWRKVDRTDGCWLWTSTLNGAGYGQFTLAGKNWMAHRLSYAAIRGELPAGLELDHLCRVRSCINPAHLEAVPHRVNMLRSPTTDKRALCKRGHELAAPNLLIFSDGARRCRTCRNAGKRNTPGRIPRPL